MKSLNGNGIGSCADCVLVERPKSAARAGLVNLKFFAGTPVEGGTPKSGLLAQLELLGDGLVTGGVGGVEIIQQPPALADHDQQSTAGAVILLVCLEMLGEVVDTLGEERDLHVSGTGILCVELEIFDCRLLIGHNAYSFVSLILKA
jgi:hypothetical protein